MNLGVRLAAGVSVPEWAPLGHRETTIIAQAYTRPSSSSMPESARPARLSGPAPSAADVATFEHQRVAAHGGSFTPAIVVASCKPRAQGLRCGSVHRSASARVRMCSYQPNRSVEADARNAASLWRASWRAPLTSNRSSALRADERGASCRTSGSRRKAPSNPRSSITASRRLRRPVLASQPPTTVTGNSKAQWKGRLVRSVRDDAQLAPR